MKKRIIIICLTLLFVSSIVYAQDYTFSLSAKYDSAPAKQTTKKKTDWLFVGMAGTYFTLSVLDLHSTYRGLANGCREANPVMALIIDNKPLTIAIKLGATLLIIHELYKLKKKNRLASYITLGCIILFQGYIVYHNYKIGGPKN